MGNIDPDDDPSDPDHEDYEEEFGDFNPIDNFYII
jgi:hypothetical protein